MHCTARRQGHRWAPATIGAGALLLGLVCLLGWPAEPRQGVAAGEARSPMLDALNRPITAGGFLDDGPVFFADVTGQTGLEGFRHRSGPAQKRHLLEVPSGGVALFDYNGDGWLDIYLVSGSTLKALRGEEPHPRSALFRNNRDGTFTDVTLQAGVANEAWGFGAVVGDFDNDGRPDLYVTNFGANRLYRNNGDGTFTDVAAASGET